MTYGPLGDEMVHFTYDCRNRLIKAGDIEYTYDAEDIRISTSTPAYTEVYTTDSVTSLSRVLEIKRTYKNNGGKNLEHEVYYYGNGLSYEKLYDNQENSVDSELFVYHYDHLGSTKILTDRDGEVTARFSYGTYGELLTTEYISGDSEYGVDKDKGNYTPHISFLYNGQLGVMTDDNGLYYMRARYYNPDIKRFINQDILTGNIGNSTSLNRYSYVEGNPVSCTDPFGLSPLKTLHQNFHKLMFLSGVGRIFAAADAVLYALEGDWENAAISGLFVIPGAQYVFLGLAAGQIVGMYVDELTNDGKRNDVLVENFVEGINDYYGIDKMSDGEIVFVLVTYALSGGYAYSEAQAAKAAEIAELNIRNEVYSYLEPNIDLNYTGGVSSPEELGMLGKGGSGSDLDGVRIINKKYAGKTFKLSGDLGEKYPKGVNFSNEGFPDFEPYSIKKVTINNLEGDAYYDFIKANEAVGYSSTPTGYTWHHVEDGKTMLLVPSDLHGAVRHTGGASLIRKGIRP